MYFSEEADEGVERRGKDENEESCFQVKERIKYQGNYKEAEKSISPKLYDQYNKNKKK